MTYLEKLIKEEGPILSSELIEHLINKEKGLTKEAARKRLSRIKSNIIRVKGLFADGQFLFHEKEIFNTVDYYTGLYNALKKAGKQYFTIIQSLDFHYGQLKTEHLPSYSISPVLDLKGHVTFSSVLEKLISLRLITIKDDFILLSNIPDSNFNSKKAKGLDVAKNFILIQFNDWSRKIGLVSYNSSKFYSEFGKYQFNFVSPSYIGTLPKNNKTNLIPGFVVADILIGNTVNENQIEFFLNKIKAIKYQKNISNFIPFLIVESIDTKSLNKLKSQGVVIGFVNELFGDNYKELLNSLINLVTNAGAILKKNPEAYLDLISKLNKLVDGKTNNLRGDLFELAVGYYQGRICKSIDIGKIINYEGLQREIDVFGFTESEIFISECKGYNHKVSKEEVEIWLSEKTTIIRKWVLDNYMLRDKNLTFEFWSTGGFTDEAIEFLTKKKEKTKKYKIDFFDLNDMLNKSRELKSKKFTEILREYYTKEI
ncbi:hypothetical protein PG913_08160 [Tenacibaculum pacificus]|uniref:hypothetical protein n=1 Tax=Tenacibaculum pacificus TaxID=3018314 RepID=UPI0022F3F630|nr:hypothetical protein [Tenacibaculum pacificus]WBX72877.1 hypothetical protein PG913_08160 [Tenacibaculum pacificus]